MNINGVLYPVHIFAKYTGFAAYTIDNRTSRKYPVILACLRYTMLTFLSWCCLQHLGITIPSVLFNIILSGIIILKHTNIWVCIIVADFWPNKNEAILNNLHQLDLRLNKYGGILSYRRLRLYSCIILVFYLSVVIINLTIDYLYIDLTRKISQLSIIYSNISLTVSITYFSTIVLILNNISAAIRSILTEHFLNDNKQITLLEEDRIILLNDMRNIYQFLMGTTETFNRIISLQILMYFSVEFGYVIVTLFSCLHAIIHNTFGIFTALRLYNSTVSFIKLCVITIISHHYQKEVRLAAVFRFYVNKFRQFLF